MPTHPKVKGTQLEIPDRANKFVVSIFHSLIFQGAVGTLNVLKVQL